MGMSTGHIKAFIPDTDPEYQKHLRIYKLCEKENVSLPKETFDYFDGCDVPLDKLIVKLKENTHYKKWSEDMEEGVEIFLNKLPKEISVIRVYNSY